MNSVLQVGVVVDSGTPAAWVVKTLHDIQQHPLMQLSVVIQDVPNPVHTKRQRVFARLAHWLLHSIINNPHFDHDPWAATKPDDQIKMNISDKETNYLEHCDVTLCLTNDPYPRQLASAQTPVWTASLPLLEQGIIDSLINRSPFIWLHLWELKQQIHNDTVRSKDYKNTGSSSNMNTSECIASHSLPCQTYSISDLRRLSYSALPSVFMSRLIWLANSTQRKLDSLDEQARYQGVFDEDRRLALANAQQLLKRHLPINKTSINPTEPLMQVICLLLKQSVERVHHRLCSERWQLAIVHSKDTNPLTLKQVTDTPLHDYVSIAKSDDVMWADPHLIEYQDNTYVFFEQMRAHGQPAHIAYGKLDEQGKLVDTGIALKTDFHLSFPHVFTHEGVYYMIPETSAQRQIALYKAVQFPDKWQLDSILLNDINAADSVLFEHNGLYWMFTNCQSHVSVDERDELHLYYSENLTGPWKAHALNPVLTGVDRSRMAGPIIKEEGALYRSSQYGAWRYGYGINISRIEELTPTSYKESAVSRMVPQKGNGWSGCHSLSKLGNLAVVDRVHHSRF